VGNAFYYSNFAVERDGTLWAWGANWNGMLGLGHMSSPVTTPQRVERWLK